ncbi:hypothetical protein MMC10_010384, partial [Thelotrema lepadinum]|nr:hypothetical protein [Thelotrema lepadinum]
MFIPFILHAFTVSGFLFLDVLANQIFDPASYDPEDVLTADVAVVGGGSAGVYSAIRLQQDYNRSIVVIEKNDYLGGNAETYTDPQSGIAINLGVIAFPQTPTVKSYFVRFNISLIPFSLSYTIGTYIDYTTGKTVNYTPPAIPDVGAALEGYTAQLEKYPALQGSFNLTYCQK